METTGISKTKIQEKREYLKQLSAPFRLMKKEGAIDSINDGLKDFYAENGHEELNTLKQWNKKGYSVKKGEKALLLWARPKKFEVVNADTSEVDEMDFYPLCFVFSQKQVAQKGGAQ